MEDFLKFILGFTTPVYFIMYTLALPYFIISKYRRKERLSVFNKVSILCTALIWLFLFIPIRGNYVNLILFTILILSNAFTIYSKSKTYFFLLLILPLSSNGLFYYLTYTEVRRTHLAGNFYHQFDDIGGFFINSTLSGDNSIIEIKYGLWEKKYWLHPFASVQAIKYKEGHYLTFCNDEVEGLKSINLHDRGKKIYHDGIVAFQENGKKGFIDTLNNVIIPPIYDKTKGYTQLNEFKIIVLKKNNKYGAITYNNRILIPFEFDKYSYGSSNIPQDSILFTKGKEKFMFPLKFD